MLTKYSHAMLTTARLHDELAHVAVGIDPSKVGVDAVLHLAAHDELSQLEVVTREVLERAVCTCNMHMHMHMMMQRI